MRYAVHPTPLELRRIIFRCSSSFRRPDSPGNPYPGVRIVNDDPAKIVAAPKAKGSRDIWLFGGGGLFRTLLNAGLVDTVELAVMPVLLGSGIPLLTPGSTTKLVLSDVNELD